MKNVVIVGVGALGSHVTMFLRNVDAKIKIVDFDRVEQKNVLSQFHGKPNVGKGKAASLQQTMNFLYGVKIDAVPHKLTSDNVKELLGGADLVVDCLDNGKSRRVVQDFVRAASVPCLHGGLSAAADAYGRVVWDEDFIIDDEAGVGAATCEDGGALPFIALVSSYLARAAQEYLANGRKIGFSVHSAGAIRT